jgi:hypothetical protein
MLHIMNAKCEAFWSKEAKQKYLQCSNHIKKFSATKPLPIKIAFQTEDLVQVMDSGHILNMDFLEYEFTY